MYYRSNRFGFLIVAIVCWVVAIPALVLSETGFWRRDFGQFAYYGFAGLAFGAIGYAMWRRYLYIKDLF